METLTEIIIFAIFVICITFAVVFLIKKSRETREAMLKEMDEMESVGGIAPTPEPTPTPTPTPKKRGRPAKKRD